MQQKKSTEAQIRATKKYANSKYRPNVYMDKQKEPIVKERIAVLGYASFNEYVEALIQYDFEHDVCPRKSL